jgi:hypothetical protein
VVTAQQQHGGAHHGAGTDDVEGDLVTAERVQRRECPRDDTERDEYDDDRGRTCAAGHAHGRAMRQGRPMLQGGHGG